jgi:hypothetical protein
MRKTSLRIAAHCPDVLFHNPCGKEPDTGLMGRGLTLEQMDLSWLRGSGVNMQDPQVRTQLSKAAFPYVGQPWIVGTIATMV